MRDRATWLSAGVLTLALGTGAWWLWTSSVRPGADPLGEAREAYERGEFERSGALARERLRADRDDPRAILMLARSHARRGDAASARRMYDRIDRQAMEAEDLYLLGVILRREGRSDEARTAFEMAEAFDPDHAETIAARIEQDLDDGQFERVVAGSDRLDGRPGWDAFAATMRGFARQGLLDPEAAALDFDQALRLDPGAGRVPRSTSDVRKALARAWLSSGRGERAGSALAEVDRPDAEEHWLISRAALQRGDVESAIASRDRSRSLGFVDDPMRIEPAPYVGSDSCAECHAAIVRDQRASNHARTFHPDPDSRLLPIPGGPVPDPGVPGVVHRIRAERGAVVFEAEADGIRSWARILHLIGSGARGMTPVGIDGDGRVVELRLSHYGEEVGWSRTTGHPEAPGSPGEFLGLPLSDRDQRACLGCHTTNVREAGARSGPTTADGAIGCERCHGPGGNHRVAIELGFPEPAIARPRLASAGQVVGLCGDCHRPPTDAPLPESSHPSAVRFQAATFARSPCFARAPASSKFDCVSCHDPHRNLEHDPRHYEAACLSCHPGPAADSPGPGGQAPCPVNPTRGCIDCHMPRRPSTMQHTEFTDHHIRVPSDRPRAIGAAGQAD